MLPCSTRQTVDFRPVADKKAREAAARALTEAYKLALAKAEEEGLESEAAGERASTAATEAAAAAREEAYEAAAAEDPDQPVYRLAVPSELDKTEITAAVLAAGVKPVTQQQIRASLRRLIGQYADPDMLARVIDALDRLDAGEASQQDVALIGEAETLVMADEGYRRLAAMQIRWEPYLRWHAAKRLLRGWENVKAKDLPPNHVIGANAVAPVPDHILAQLPPAHLQAVGTKAIALLSTDEDEAKN